MQIAINELEIVLAPPEEEGEGREERREARQPAAPRPAPMGEQLRAARRREERLMRVRAG